MVHHEKSREFVGARAGMLSCAVLAACLSIAGCDSDAAEIQVDVAADHSGAVDYTRLLGVTEVAPSEGGFAAVTGVADAKIMDVSVPRMHAKFTRLEGLDVGGIKMTLTQDEKGLLPSVTVPTAATAAWRALAPDIAAVVKSQTLGRALKSRPAEVSLVGVKRDQIHFDLRRLTDDTRQHLRVAVANAYGLTLQRGEVVRARNDADLDRLGDAAADVAI